MDNNNNNVNNNNNNKEENIMKTNIVIKIGGFLTKIQGIMACAGELRAEKVIRKIVDEAEKEPKYEVIGENETVGSYTIDERNFDLPRFKIKLKAGGYSELTASIHKDKDDKWIVDGKSNAKAYFALYNQITLGAMDEEISRCIEKRITFEKAKAETVAVQVTKEQAKTTDMATEIAGIDRFGRPILKKKFAGFDVKNADLNEDVEILGKTYRLVVIKALDCSKLFFQNGKLLANVNWKKDDPSPKVYIKAGATPDIGYFLMFDGHIADSWIGKKPHKAELETEAQARFLGDIFTNVVSKIAEIKGYQFPQKAIYHEPEYLEDPAYWEAAEKDYVNQLPKFMRDKEA